ncbi:hypothetical protein G6F22_005140 [Rhizopus arrhizus]|nr:hypothetical protein G6F22_005140 [Rhizopus arrhizus]KAG1412230.1 hypothetical protein G6F58_008126 [Rhizopus delemar]
MLPISQMEVVGSADARVSIFKTEKDIRKVAEASIERHIDEISCVAVHDSRFVTAGTDGFIITYKNNEYEKILIRSTVAVRSVVFNPQGMKIAIAGDDNDIRVVLIADNSKIVSLQGHTTSLKSIDYDPTGEYIASSSCDGDIRIWSVGPNEPAPRCVKVLKNITPASKPDHALTAKVLWSPDKSCFAFPGKNNDIRMFTYGLWTPYSTLENGHTETISTFSWSPNGYYMATTSKDKLLIVWDVKKKKIVRKAIVVASITEIAWHPEENQLVFANENGEIMYWDEVIPEGNSNYPHPAKIRRNTQIDSLETQSQDPYSLEPSSLDPRLLESRATNNANEHFFDTMADDEDGEDLRSEENDDIDMMDAEDDFVIDDDGAGYAETPEERQRMQALHQQRLNLSRMGGNQYQRPVVFDPPSAFQPGETPYNKDKDNRGFDPMEGERRYLCYNLVGAMYTIYQDNHSIINVEFHDQSAHRNFHFTDYSNFTMGSLSEAGSIFAVEGKEALEKPKKTRINDEGEEETDDEEDDGDLEKITASTLHFRPLSMRAGGDKDWTYHLPLGEDVVAVAINSASVIAATSTGFIRIFSLSGIQKHIFTLNNIVTLSAMNDLALLVYAAGPAFTGQQNMEYLLLNTDANEILQKDKIQLSIGSELAWAGFSETTQAAIYDSESILRILHHQRRPNQAAWVPVFNGKAHAKSIQRTESYWPVGVLRDRLMCIILRGDNKYPFFPRPPVNEVPLELPLIEPTSETGKIELAYLSMLYRDLHERDEAEATQKQDEYQDAFDSADIEMDKDILRLINIACKAERHSRALDLVNSLRLSESVDKAIRVATYHHLSSLANSMMRVKELKFMSRARVLPPSLSEALASQPSIYESNMPSLENGLSLLEKNEGDGRKRLILDDDTDDVVMDSLNNNSHKTKKPRPFQFS